MLNRKVRVRFAPSPTGPLHIGGVRTALFNYLFAKKHQGDFILRIEDTDQTRFVAGAEKYIIDSLAWAGLKFDESVTVGGNFGPYRQSDRKDLYSTYIKKRIDNGSAYYAFDTIEELEQMRQKLEQEKAPVQHYGPVTRINMKNSLTLSEAETRNILNSHAPYVIRFKMPESEEIVMRDIIRGEVRVNSATLDDKVLFKSDGMPTYHLANIVDDYLMQISHVIRGEEWLPSLPLHVMLYKSFGWENEMPQFAHLPLILKPDGKGKLSKRDGDRLGFPVFPMDWIDDQTGEKSSGYRQWGYLPEAFVNMLALLGWNPGTEREIYALSELAELFSLEKVGKSGSKFDPEKAKWFNQQYIKNLPDTLLANVLEKQLSDQNIDHKGLDTIKICSLIKDRCVLLPDLLTNSEFFFVAPKTYNDKVVKKFWNNETRNYLTKVAEILQNIQDFSSENTELAVKQWIEQEQIAMGKVMNTLRLALVGDSKGPHLFDIVSITGRNECIYRIENTINTLTL